ncbi:hypothetical protein P7H22_00070 [Paenibacillus larvae]|nr:hypothetical protein [Paenibacillus larvae]MDT2239110.1 hypothetical protein [Paenibacillus larvae]
MTGINRPDPIRMITLVDEIMDHIQPGDQVFIEGFAHAARGIMSAKCLESDGESEWHLRQRSQYTEVTPSQLKKFASGKMQKKRI